MWEFSTTHESSKLACAGEFDACVDNPCQNSGACTDVVGGAYDASGRTCTCGDGFTGDSCETDVHACTANPCQNSGACTDVVGGASDASGRTCTCGNGFTGDSCETGASCSLVPGDANGSEYHVSSDYTAEQCLAKCVIDGANAMTVGSNVSFGNGSTGSCYCEVGATRLGSSSSSWKNCFIAATPAGYERAFDSPGECLPNDNESRNLGPGTVDECAAHCPSDSRCVAFDFDY